MSRLERVAELIRAEISILLQRKVNDPRIGFVSLTEVTITPDLKYAKIFVSIMGDETAKLKSLEGLKSAKSYIRGELGHLLDLRIVPDITFVRDDSIERGTRVLNLIKKLETKGEQSEKKPKKSSRKAKKK